MTQVGDEEADLRRWLVGYLVTTIGLDPEQVDVDLPFNELGVGSRDGVVLAGELSELLGSPVSPIDIWQNPTVAALAHALTHPGEDTASAVDGLNAVAADLSVEPIAIIGLGCRMPGDINGPDDLWEFLAARRSAVTAVPDDRWRPFDDGSPQTAQALAATTRWGSFLSDVAGFDAEFFGITPREADYIDPQQRLILEVTVEALEHAGIPAESLHRSQTGVFVGACVSEYGYLASRDLNQIQAWTGTGGSLSIIANRLSYFLDLHGPSLTIDTACSSSLVAVHLACQSLRTGQSELAIAGGVNMLLSPVVTRSFDQAEAMSPTGACHAFDAAADGFVRGEGCGVVILKRLSDAVRDGDQVLALVRGSAVNQDGRSNGLMAPNPAAQAAVLRAACADAGVDPASVDYVEAHGTGTLLGDPIEARALGAVYGRGRQSETPLLIGAAKTNLGHLEAAAGIAGLIKATLAVQRGVIPPNQHFDNPNPHIPFEELGLKVADEPIEWPLSDHPRLAGVSSFGFGGTNAHVVLEQAPRTAPALSEPTLDPPVTTLVVSGKSAERMAAAASAIAEWMAGPGAAVPLADVAHTLNHHRTHHPVFATVCATDRDGAVAALRALAAGEAAPGVVAPHAGSCGPGTVFVYSGQGSQWTGMGRRLLADEPSFAAAIADLDVEFIGQLGFSLRDVIANGEEVEGSVRVQSVLFGIQVALTALWRSYGVEPDVVIGHSMGEVSAAVAAGVFTAGEGLEIIAARSQLMAGLADKGAVALLELDAAAAESLIADYPGVTITVYSSPRQTAIAGPVEAIEALIEAARERNIFARRVNMEVASHHAMMDPILPELRDSLAHLVPGFPVVPIISTVENAGDTAQFDADHWVANVRRPVRFADAVATAAVTNCTFIEISPHPVLTKAISDTLADPGTANDHHHCIGTLQRDGNDTVAFHTALNSTFTARPFIGAHPPEPHPALPSTPWRHSRHWLDFTPVSRHGDHSAGAQNSPVPADWLYEPTWPSRPLSEGDSAETGPWSVVGDDDLAAQLGGGSLDGARHVLFAPAAGGSSFDIEAAYRIFNEGRRLATRLASMPDPPTLHLLTRNAQPIADGDRANPVQAVLWGLGRTLALEHPEVWGGVIDVDESMPPVLAARLVCAEAAAPDGEDQVVYRSGIRHVPRLTPTAPPPSAAELSADSSHLVIGATGHLGPHIIRQLVEMGAGTVVAVSRNPGDGLKNLAAQLEASGARLVTVAADATSAADMAALFDRFGTDLPPLEGIYLAAFAGGPVTLSQMTDADVATMFAPKLDALRIVDELSLDSTVRHFVLFSSISGLLGSRWLAHYTATSTFLDTFAYARRNLGLPATVVNWGLWKSLADTSSEGAVTGEVMTDAGLQPMPDEVAIRALPMVMGSAAPVRTTIVAADWPLLAAAYRTRGALRILDDVLQRQAQVGAAAPESEFRKELRDCPAEGRRQLLADHIAATASAVMGLPASERLDPTAGFFQLGMDSLMSVTLQRRLGASLGIELPAALIFEHPTVRTLTEALCERLGIDDAPSTDGAARSGLAARAQQRAKARQGAAASRRKGHVG